MTQDLSASTLETVRRNMTVMSFLIIVFHVAEGYLIDGSVRLLIINVEFLEPQRLVYILLGLLGWWLYRYFSLGALEEYKNGLSSECYNYLMTQEDTRSEIYKNFRESIAPEHIEMRVDKSSGQWEIYGYNTNAARTIKKNVLVPCKLQKHVQYVIPFKSHFTVTFSLPIFISTLAVGCIIYDLWGLG